MNKDNVAGVKNSRGLGPKAGTAFGIMGATLVALDVTNMALPGYLFFLASSSLWSWTAAKRQDIPLLMLNITFTAINLLGILRRIEPVM